MSELPPLPRTPLDAATFSPDPLLQFHRWYEAAREAGLPQPDAMALATATPDGRPSVRMVLLKGADHRGFRFFTHYDSRKGREIAANPRVALVLHWEPLGRQVRIEGLASEVDPRESNEYFLTRPEGSRFAAAASPQSQVIHSRADLEARVTRLREIHPHGEVPRPERWGGYRVAPFRVEFWQQGRDRLHDRLRYERKGDGWTIARLAP
jgi:pyridoxamine 5'-phosphate oxidase